MGYFALPHFYVTMNPNAKHSPIFHAMWGDEAVDLSERFPQLVDGMECGKRVASDLVTGADFFSFSLECFFCDLLGWDASKQQSTPTGGILGKIRAYYGVAEFTDRGQLHGHFLIWLDGGLNPSDVHNKMRNDPVWKDQFFAYFEDVVKHELPDTADVADPAYEPCSDRPPNPDAIDFAAEFVSDVKKLGECVQRHSTPCKPVCHKYGSRDCRFGFPHDIVENSAFHQDSNSILLCCHDPTINWYNPIILSSCRHNHDIKCILSGKSAKAAMFYISDYITKNDEKLWQLMSMFSRSISANTSTNSNLDKGLGKIDKARKLLHQCLAAVIREQKIHGQQAAHYLRGGGDGISTHTTVPMYSYAVTSYVRSLIQPSEHGARSSGRKSELARNVDADETDSDDEDDDFEVAPLTFVSYGDIPADDDATERVRLTKDGTLSYFSHQVHDYVYRDEKLRGVNFYDFVRCYQKVLLSHSGGQYKETGSLPRFNLVRPHPQAPSHLLLQQIDPSAFHPTRELVPRIVGCSIPRREQDDTEFAMFMLAHFHPFSVTNPIRVGGKSPMQFLDSVDLSSHSMNVMKNWESIHECEDQRDAERMRKRQSHIKQSKDFAKSVQSEIPPDYFESPDAYALGDTQYMNETLDPATAHMRAALVGANWFDADDSSHRISQSHSPDSSLEHPIGTYSGSLKYWDQQIKIKTNQAAAARRSQLDPSRQTMACNSTPPTVHGAQARSSRPLPFC
jgi:hypothetical protein